MQKEILLKRIDKFLNNLIPNLKGIYCILFIILLLLIGTYSFFEML